MDLGTLLLDIGTQYVKSKYGAPQAPAAMRPWKMPPVPAGGAPGIAATPAFLDLPGIDIVGDPGDLVAKAVASGGKLIYDYVTGKWKIQRRRRRRRRLATATDIKDLAALSGTVGKGQLMREWVATHPSY